MELAETTVSVSVLPQACSLAEEYIVCVRNVLFVTKSEADILGCYKLYLLNATYASVFSKLWSSSYYQCLNPVGGSTELWRPLRALSLLPPSQGVRNLLLLSDGHIQNAELTLQLLRDNVQHSRLFTCGLRSECVEGSELKGPNARNHKMVILALLFSSALNQDNKNYSFSCTLWVKGRLSFCLNRQTTTVPLLMKMYL